jgi:hypothetical protein
MNTLGPTDAQKEAVAVLSKAARENQSNAGKIYGRGKPPIAFPKIDKVHMDQELAKMFNVSKGYIHEARKIKQFCDEYGYNEVCDQLRNGTLSMQDAKRRVATLACEIVENRLSLSKPR